jgi:hypothetical protein
MFTAGYPVAMNTGIPPRDLSDEDLVREMQSLHRTRDDAVRHGPDAALDHHDRRTAELEAEYLRRFPDREVTPRGQDPVEAELEPDFAEEHSSPTFADEQRGGAERAPEPESPRGLAGMDG